MQFVPQAVKTVVSLAAVAGAVLATSAAHAVVVYTPVSLVVPASTAGLYVNVVTGANNSVAASVPGWDINPWGSAGLGFFSPTTPAGGAYVMEPASTTRTANLPLGSVIGAGSSFGSGSSTAANATQWNLNSSNNYFGFRLLNESTGQVHYGFAQLQIGSAITTRSIIGYGFESVAGANITVAAIPEPGTYGLMGLGIAGVLLAARRRKAA